ncbi:MAG: hypothetical protein ACKOXF_10555 [Chitinophagaceae bacterium]
MKNIVLSLFVLASCSLFAQSAAQPSVSVKNDTLLCNGKAVSLISVIEDNLVIGASSRAIYLPGGKNVLMITELLNYKTTDNKLIYYTHYEFPGLDISCDIKHKTSDFNPFEPVCQYNLINQYGIDTNQAFIFTTLKGRISDAEIKGVKTRQDTVTRLRSTIAVRSVYAEISYYDDNIIQDEIRIGSFTVDTLIGQKGLCRYYKIFNSKDVMICTATESLLNSRDWRLLTYKDNKFHVLKVNSEADLTEMLKYLIQRKYL